MLGGSFSSFFDGFNCRAELTGFIGLSVGCCFSAASAERLHQSSWGWCGDKGPKQETTKSLGDHHFCLRQCLLFQTKPFFKKTLLMALFVCFFSFYQWLAERAYQCFGWALQVTLPATMQHSRSAVRCGATTWVDVSKIK